MFFWKIFLCFAWLVSASLFAQESSAIRIGIAPHSSARLIFESHRDLKSFLEHYFHRPVQILTTKTFSEFAKVCNEGHLYDLIITSPNLAYLAHEDAGYAPLMTYSKGLETIILSHTSNHLDPKITLLKIAGQDPVSFATLSGEEWLEQQGFIEGKNLTYRYYISASDSLARLLVSDEVDLVIMSLPNYLKLDQELQQELFVVYHSAPKPSRIFLARDAHGLTIDAWKQALIAFSKSEEGARHLSDVKLNGFVMIDEHALDDLKTIAQKTADRLKE